MEFGIWNQNSGLAITHRPDTQKKYLPMVSALTVVVWLLTGCATPSEKFASYAEELGMSTATMQTRQFEHRVFLNKQARLGSDRDELHVYLDGDGTPWRNHYRVAEDPTSRNPLIWSLCNKTGCLRSCWVGLVIIESTRYPSV